MYRNCCAPGARSRVVPAGAEHLEARRLMAAVGPDPSYGDGGVARLDHVGPVDNSTGTTRVLSNGKVLVSTDTFGGDSDAVLIRYNTNGSLDSSFGTGGVGRYEGNGYFLRLVPQEDGSVLALRRGAASAAAPVVKIGASGQAVAGWAGTAPGLTGDNRDLLDLGYGRSLLVTGRNLVRLNADGSPDTTFGTGGVVTLPAASGNYGSFGAHAAAFQSDGQIVVVGERRHSLDGTAVAQVVRYQPGGQLDTTFGVNGVRQLPASFARNFALNHVAVGRGDDRIIVTGATSGGTAGGSGLVARLTASTGALDSTFGTGGVYTAPTSVSVGHPRVLAGGQVLLSGFRDNGDTAPGNYLFMRLTTGGRPDPTFDGDGVRDGLAPADWVPFGSGAYDLRPDGRIVLGTSYYTSDLATNDVVVLSFTAAGATDNSFGQGGRVITDVPESHNQVGFRSAIDAEGRVLFAGGVQTSISDMLVGRLTPGGVPDAPFGGRGDAVARIDGGTRAEVGYDVAVGGPGNKIVVAGNAAHFTWSTGWGDRDFMVARLLSDGTPDPAFGAGGVAVVDWGQTYGLFSKVEVAADGRVYAAGVYQSPAAGRRAVVARFLADGRPDPAFDGDGLAFVNVPGDNDGVADLMPLGDGGVLLAGSTEFPTSDPNNPDVARFVARLGPAGAPDPNYGTQGDGAVVLQAAEAGETAVGLIPAGTGGGVFLAGTASSASTGARFLLTKLSAAGVPETAFGNGGTAAAALPSLDHTINSAVRLPGGGFVATGQHRRRISSSSSDTDVLVLSLRPDGTPDPDFGTAGNGTATMDLSSTADRATDAQVTADGRLVVTGTTTTPTTGADWFAVRVDVAPRVTAVVGRHAFYNRSVYDGTTGQVPDGPNNDAAIAPGKDALLPGVAATAANVTSYTRGINGVMVDVANLPDDGAGVGLNDVSVRTTSPANPGAWSAGPAPSSVTVRPGAGVGGSDRVTLVWPDGVNVNRWVEVTVLSNTDTGLAVSDVFAFGNLIGDADGTRGVNLGDFGALRQAFGRTDLSIADGRSDFNRDGSVNLADFGTLRASFGKSLPPPPPAAGSAAVATAESASLLSGQGDKRRTRATRSDPASVLLNPAPDGP